MPNEVGPVGSKAYGGLQPSCTIGADDFAAHDGTKSWGDDGAAETMMMALAPEVRAYGAEQAKQAVLDYTQSAYGDVTGINEAICFLLDVSNDVVPYAVGWNLENSFVKAIAEAALARDGDLLRLMAKFLCVVALKLIAEAENMGDAGTLRAIGGLIEQLNATFRAPASAPSRVARPVRPGALKPPVNATKAGAAQRASRTLAPPRPAS